MEAESMGAGKDPDGPHRPGPAELWAESWYFDFVAEDGSAGGFVRVGDSPRPGLRWWWAYVAGVAGGSPVVTGVNLCRPLLADRGVPCGITDPELTCLVERAAGGWRLAAAATGFALDVEWRATAPAHRYARGDRYEQAGWARGTVTAGGTTFALDGPGQRDHSWGVRDWWRFGWIWCGGRLSDGSRFQATHLDARGRIKPDGYVITPAGELTPVRAVETDADSVVLDGMRLTFADLATVTLELHGPDGRRSRLVRSMTVVRGPGHRGGIGWRERNIPDSPRARR